MRAHELHFWIKKGGNKCSISQVVSSVNSKPSELVSTSAGRSAYTASAAAARTAPGSTAAGVIGRCIAPTGALIR